MTFSELYPKPEGALPTLPTEKPAHMNGREWIELKQEHKKFVTAWRKHRVAVAVDSLRDIERTPEQEIVYWLGIEYCHGSIGREASPLFDIFGG